MDTNNQRPDSSKDKNKHIIIRPRQNNSRTEQRGRAGHLLKGKAWKYAFLSVSRVFKYLFRYLVLLSSGKNRSMLLISTVSQQWTGGMCWAEECSKNKSL